MGERKENGSVEVEKEEQGNPEAVWGVQDSLKLFIKELKNNPLKQRNM